MTPVIRAATQAHCQSLKMCSALLGGGVGHGQPRFHCVLVGWRSNR